MNVKRGFLMSGATLSGDPVRKLSMQMTWSPSSRKRSQRCEPMNPAPPVIRTRPMLSPSGAHGGAADRHVREAVLAHDLGLVDVAPVEDERPLHQQLHAVEVRPAELVPLGHDE